MFMTRMAPKMMTRTEIESNAPLMEYAATVTQSCFHTSRAMIAAVIHARGSAFFAPQLKTSIRTMVSKIGTAAINAYTFLLPPKIKLL